MKWISWYLLLLSLPVLAEPPALLLAKTYTDDIAITDYWVSEKLDGVRAYWDGEALHSRGGHIIQTPQWFTKDFPQEKLDGELWIARGAFEDTVSTVTKHRPLDKEWRRVRYMLFELPQAQGTFTSRLASLKLLAQSSDYLKLIPQQRLFSLSALEDELDRVVAGGGEGLMLHYADALYATGRSENLLKLKKYYDAEAVVMAHLPGKGKHLGRLGALLVEMPSGKQFKLGGGFTDAQRENPPRIGGLVTYKYYGLSQRGIPKFASFMRVRESAD